MYEIDKKNLGSFIAKRRKEKGYTQKALAEHLFISDKAVSKWETGISIPDASLWIPLADLLGVTVTELLMCQHMEEPTQMDSVQVEGLIKKAIRFSNDNPHLKQRMKQQRIAIFCICIAVSCIENCILYINNAISESLLTYDFIGAIFGAYFLLLVKDSLPTYYDQNKITSYSDGFFRMNMPGLAFNNSNWPHIVNVGRIWTMAVLVCYPIIHGILYILFPAIWNSLGKYLSLLIVLGGLFIPMYFIGKKYQ